jgi:hypothetical protein
VEKLNTYYLGRDMVLKKIHGNQKQILTAQNLSRNLTITTKKTVKRRNQVLVKKMEVVHQNQAKVKLRQLRTQD